MHIIEFEPKGVCCKHMTIQIDDSGCINAVKFTGGCAGWSSAVGNLIISKPIEEIQKNLAGICCGKRDTSCPDQLAKALSEFKE